MLAGLTPTSSWVRSHAHLFRLWQGVSLVFSVIAYLGVLGAPLVTLSLPYQALYALNIQPPSRLYWFAATGLLILALGLLCLTGMAGYLGFRKRVISLDAIFFFIGLALAVAFIVWILPTGWIPAPPERS